MSTVPKIDLRLGDCLEIMRDIPSASVDAVITDPPYGVNKAEWDSEIPSTQIWIEVARVLKVGGSLLVFGGLKYMPMVMRAIGESLKYEWVIAWYKSNAMQFSKTGYNVLDLILWYSKEGAQFQNKMRDVIEYPIVPSLNDFGHMTPKPLPIMTKLVNAVEGDTILDPFMGSGTTGVACARLNRNFIGIEIHKPYFEIAQRRINDELGNVARSCGESVSKRLSESITQESIF